LEATPTAPAKDVLDVEESASTFVLRQEEEAEALGH
jgi:hypothetical protein